MFLSGISSANDTCIVFIHAPTVSQVYVNIGRKESGATNKEGGVFYTLLSTPILLRYLDGPISRRGVVEALFADNPQERRGNAFSMNRVEIIGGVANDPVSRTAKNDRPYALLNVITNSRLRLANGEYRDQIERHTVTAFGKTAEFVANNIRKGQRVLINAKLHYSGGTLDGQGVRTPRQTHIHAENIQPLARRSADSF
ncbi:single-strand binding family protein [Dictyocaulus viviparus]|uniref:Single-strand binding family protein n=1 Tax=Dictyocaulus viviparus TaxID=29172 RepID=A0A0D8XPM5_DICVI|nr:single-strand binding family protein [Dictyocaulus viviparus]